MLQLRYWFKLKLIHYAEGEPFQGSFAFLFADPGLSLRSCAPTLG
jgi:hypothetical protein